MTELNAKKEAITLLDKIEYECCILANIHDEKARDCGVRIMIYRHEIQALFKRMKFGE